MIAQGIGHAVADRPPPMATTAEKNRGRVEAWSLWVVDAGERTSYLAQE